MLNSYKLDRNRLLNRYREILKYDTLFDIISRDDIEYKIGELESEHFLVSFTGQIKSGKSTLINALIFGEEIIPSDDTPHTAKITLIKYGKTPKLEATFYSQDEWEEFKKDSNFFNKYLAHDIENSISKGIYPQEVIESNPKVNIENNLKSIADYVAKGGKYTPFINTVTIYYPSNILKDITVVDTPGTNDPNRLRDRVTKEWIDKTNANIYISYANQAMDRVDIDFIDKFLLSVPKEQKITVLNKIDTLNSKDSLNSYIDELFNNRVLIDREILTNRENLILVSGLGALIDKMLLDGKPLNEELKFYAKDLEKKGYLEPENHQLNLLEVAIEKRLIDIKGKNIINSHNRYIESIFNKKIGLLKSSINREKDSLSELIKSKEELENSAKSIKNSKLEITKEFEIIRERFIKKIKRTLDNSKPIFNNIEISILREIEDELASIKNISTYKIETYWIIKGSINSNSYRIKESIERIREDLKEFLLKEIEQFKDNFKNRNMRLYQLDSILEIYTNDITANMLDSSQEAFSKENIYSIIKDSVEWNQIFNTKRKREQITKGIMYEIRKKFEEFFKDIDRVLKESLDRDLLNGILNSIEEMIMVSIENKESSINEYIDNIDNKMDSIQEHKERLILFEKELKEVEKYKAQ